MCQPSNHHFTLNRLLLQALTDEILCRIWAIADFKIHWQTYGIAITISTTILTVRSFSHGLNLSNYASRSQSLTLTILKSPRCAKDADSSRGATPPIVLMTRKTTMTKRLPVYFAICFFAGVLLGLCLNEYLDSRVKEIQIIKPALNWTYDREL